MMKFTGRTSTESVYQDEVCANAADGSDTIESAPAINNNAGTVSARRAKRFKPAIVASVCAFALVVGVGGFTLSTLTNDKDFDPVSNGVEVINQAGLPSEITAENSVNVYDTVLSADGEEYVANQVLVTVSGTPNIDTLTSACKQVGANLTAFRLVSGFDGGAVVLLAYEGSIAPEDVASYLVAQGYALEAGADYVVEATDAEATTVEGSTDVANSDASGVVAESATLSADAAKADAPDDPYFSSQWEFAAMNVLAAWGICNRPAAVTVAVLDTGCSSDNIDLYANMLGYYGLCTHSYTNQTKTDSNPAYSNQGREAVADNNGHGTHVAGIISACSNNTFGTAGVSNNQNLLIVKCLGASSTSATAATGTISDAVAAFDAVTNYKLEARQSKEQNPALLNIKVINTSLGVANNTYANLSAAVARAQAADILVVASAGNNSSRFTTYTPGSIDGVIAVANLKHATDAIGTSNEYMKWTTSNTGPYIDLAAPGTEITSAGLAAEAVAVKTGTSQAAPMVSAVAALVAAANPVLSATEIADILFATAKDLGASGKDEMYGYGMVQADKAVMAALNLKYATAEISDNVKRYTKTMTAPTVTAEFAGRKLVQGVDFTLTYNGSAVLPSAAGTYEVAIVGAETQNKQGFSYFGSVVVGTFTVYEGAEVDESIQYRIVSAADDSYVLDVAKAIPERGSNVSIWTNNQGQNQLFTFKDNGDGTYTIYNVANKTLVLDAAGSTPKKGSNVSTWTYNGANALNQRWIIQQSAVYPGYVVIRSAADPTLVLDAAGSSPSKGANVSIWTENSAGALNQLWWFAPSTDLSFADVSATGMARNYSYSDTTLPLPEITVSLNGKTLKQGVDYEVLYDGGLDTPTTDGEYRVSIQGINSYEGVREIGTFKLYAINVEYGVSYRIGAHITNYTDILDVAGATPVRGANVSIWSSNGGANQFFTLEQSSDGYIVLRNVMNPKLVLDAASTNPYPGANVSTWDANGGLNQKWILLPQISPTEMEFIFASAANPDYVLNVAGSNPTSGSNVNLDKYTGADNQKFQLIESNDLAYAQCKFENTERNYTGKALFPTIEVTHNKKSLVEGVDYEVTYTHETSFGDVDGDPIEPGVYRVYIDGIGDYIGSVPGPLTFTIYDAAAISGGEYRIVSASPSTKPFNLDVAGMTPKKGANVSIWTNNGGDNQLFWMWLDDDGYYTLYNVANSDLVLDAAGATPKIGANVSTWTYNGPNALNQKWVLKPAYDTKGNAIAGAFVIASASNPSFVLDAAGATPKIGANVSIWTANGGRNQAWYFQSIETDKMWTKPVL